MDFMHATKNDIIADAKKNGRVQFLKDLIAKDEKIGFMQLKRAYFQEFYSEQVPAGKRSFRDDILDL